jgi:phospholipid transport system substrate-binding protein
LKKLLLIVCSIIFSALAQAEVDQSDPYAMVEQVAQQTFDRFAREKAQIRQNPEILKDIVRQELLPYIDYRYSAYKVIGSYLKKTTKAQRDAFVQVFREYLVTSYAQVFTLYDEQKIEFGMRRETVGKKIVTVNTVVIEESGRPPIKIDFKVRNNKKTNKWKAFDMVAEGVSLLDSKQAELSSIIRQQGIDEVTAMLKAKSEQKIRFADAEAQDKELVSDAAGQG